MNERELVENPVLEELEESAETIDRSFSAGGRHRERSAEDIASKDAIDAKGRPR